MPFECIMPTLTFEPPSHNASNKPNFAVTTRPRLWTPSLKVMGNLIPAALATPFAGYGIWWMAASGQVGARGFWVFAMSPLVGWLAMNFWGLHQNQSLKTQLLKKLRITRPDVLQSPICFVGIATPKYSSMLDPHEDIGYLILEADRLEFFGDHLNLSIAKKDISGIDYRPNPHSLVGLGRWVAVEGRVGDSRIRLQMEPRERRTLLGNLLFSRTLRRQIEGWLIEKESRVEPGTLK